MLLPATVERLAHLGANIDITDSKSYLPTTVEAIIRAAKASGGHVTISAGKFLPATLESFVRIGGNSVTIRI